MTFMSTTAFAVETIVPEIDEAIFCNDCVDDHIEALVTEEEIVAVESSCFRHNWVNDYRTMTYVNNSPTVKATYCYFHEIYRMDFQRCTSCGTETASTYYYWKVESKYHTWSGNKCTSCGYTK